MASKRKKIFLGIILTLILLPVLLLWLAVQPFFIRALILPKVEAATDSRISFEDLKLSPFKSLSVSNLTYAANDQSMDAQVEAALIQYNLINMLKGNIQVDQVLLTAPEVTIQNPPPDLRPPAAQVDAKKDGVPAEETPSSSPQLQIQNIQIVNGTFNLQQNKDTLTLTDIQLTVPEIRNGSQLEMDLKCRITGQAANSPEYNGNLSSKFAVLLGETLLPTEIQGTLTAGLNVPDAGALSLQMNVDSGLDLTNKALSLRELSVQADQNRVPFLELDLLKATELNFGVQPPVFTDTEITLAVHDLDFETFPFATLLPVPAGTLAVNSHVKIENSGKTLHAALNFETSGLKVKTAVDTPPLQLLEASGDAKLDWQAESPLQFLVNIQSGEVIFPDGRSLPAPLTFETSGKISLESLTVEQLQFAWKASPDFENQIALTATADWTRKEAMNIQADLRGKRLDLSPWAAWIQPQEPAAPAPELRPKSSAEPAATPQLSLPVLPLEQLKLTVKADALQLESARLEELDLHLTATAREVNVDPLSVKINGSPFENSGSISWPDDLITLNVQSRLSPLNLEPVIDSLLPEKKGAITGMLQSNGYLSTSGKELTSLKKNLLGALELSYTEGKIKLIDSDPDQYEALFHTRKLVQDIVRALAGVLQLSPEQLMAPEIESVLLSGKLQQQELALDKVELVNPEFLVSANGVVLLQEDVGQSIITSLPVTVGVSTNLAKRVKIYRDERVLGDHVVLPPFIEVTGTLATPELEVKKGVITGLIISGVTERNEVGNENVQLGLEVLGSILSGEPIPEKPKQPQPTPVPGEQPAPTPKPGKTERVLEGLELLRQLRATPTPKP